MQLIGEDISATRDTSLLFENVNFRIDGGQSLLVTGENGSGKSTLLRIVAGLLKPQAGAIRFMNEGKQSLRGNLHYLGHQNAMKPNLSVEENLKFWQAFDQNEDGAKKGLSIGDALNKVGLLGKELLPFNVLSTGQKRRVAIARLLLNSRSIWLLDEPTSGLDMPSTAMLAREMRDHMNAGGIVVAATHLPLGLDDGHTLQLGLKS